MKPTELKLVTAINTFLIEKYIQAEKEVDLEGLKVFGKVLHSQGFTRSDIERIKEEWDFAGLDYGESVSQTHIHCELDNEILNIGMIFGQPIIITEDMKNKMIMLLLSENNNLKERLEEIREQGRDE